jgi:PPOX class probable F420-dependent enzyme
MTVWETATARERIDAFLARPNHAIVGVNRAAGAPQLTVVWYLWDGESFRISTMRSRAKYANIMRDPAISLLVDNAEENWYLVAYGTAEFRQHDAAFSRELFRKYLPDHPNARTGADDPDRVVIVLRPRRILTGS